MTDFDPQTSPARKRTELAREDWEALMAALAPDRAAAGQKYEALRRRLTNLFAWEQCELPDALTDEAMNRLARKVHEGVEIPHIDRFAFGIARMLIHEHKRAEQRRQTAVREFQSAAASTDDATLDAMHDCIGKLPRERREVIESYYREDRAQLAARLGISLNALRNRALRIREDLFECMSRKRDEL